MRMGLLAAIGGLCLLPATGTLAQDAGYDWTGFYAGILGGQTELSGVVGNFHLDGTPVPIVDDFTVPISGLSGGIALGANWQYGNLVVGAEADHIFSSAGGSHLDTTMNFTTTATLDRMVTLRGRAGFAVDNLLLFVTAGLALADINVEYNDEDTLIQNKTNRYVGWVAGGGAELGVTENLSIKGEVFYHRLGTQTYEFMILSPGGTLASDATIDGWSGRVGVNFRIN